MKINIKFKRELLEILSIIYMSYNETHWVMKMKQKVF